jgi:hypothetical protein
MAAEHFRQHIFGISVQNLCEFRSQVRKGMIPAARVLNEAAQMLLGMMQRDGTASLSCVLDSAADAIWLHETWSDASVRAVEKFLEVARRRSDIVSPWQMEHLEDSLSTVRSFIASAPNEEMMMAMDETETAFDEFLKLRSTS